MVILSVFVQRWCGKEIDEHTNMNHENENGQNSPVHTRSRPGSKNGLSCGSAMHSLPVHQKPFSFNVPISNLAVSNPPVPNPPFATDIPPVSPISPFSITTNGEIVPAIGFHDLEQPHCLINNNTNSNNHETLSQQTHPSNTSLNHSNINITAHDSISLKECFQIGMLQGNNDSYPREMFYQGL